MKKIYGIFRGFPGLGRVSSGISILKEFQNMGYDIAAISYLQGLDALQKQSVPLLLNYEIKSSDITSIGINPITHFATKIICKILEEKPDIVIIDGEPLLQSTLCDVYPKEKVVALLNPSDLHNDTLPESTIKFYHKNYLSSSNAIVHGIGIKNKFVKKNDCDIYYIPTLLRQEILEISRINYNSKRIIGVLGGGSVNSSDEFIKSTIEIGKKIIILAKHLNNYSFDIYCNDTFIKNEILKNISLSLNINIISSYTAPRDIYKDVRIAIVRAGRNVASELLYLGIPSLLVATSGDYRAKEQEKNIDNMILESSHLFKKINLLDTTDILISKVNELLNIPLNENVFIPGNKHAIEILKKIIGE